MLKKNVAEGIHCVEDSNVNWFIVEGTEGLTIVDAGLPAETVAGLREAGIRIETASSRKSGS